MIYNNEESLYKKYFGENGKFLNIFKTYNNDNKKIETTKQNENSFVVTDEEYNSSNSDISREDNCGMS